MKKKTTRRARAKKADKAGLLARALSMRAHPRYARVLAEIAVALYTSCLLGYDVRPLIRAVGLPAVAGKGCCSAQVATTQVATTHEEH